MKKNLYIPLLFALCIINSQTCSNNEERSQLTFKMNGFPENGGTPTRRHWLPVKCNGGGLYIRNECREKSTKVKYGIHYTALDLNLTPKDIREKFQKIDPKDPLKACVNHIFKTAKGNMSQYVEFKEFLSNLCLEAGAGTKQVTPEEW